MCLAKLDEHGADVVGGTEVAIPYEDNLSSRLVSAVLSSRFGVGGNFRTVMREGPTDTATAGVYRREVFERIGLFDERLVRNQDNEFNSRLRAAGGQAWTTTEACLYYYSRATLRTLLRQNFRNGLYGMLAWRLNPASFTVRHAVPLAFVLFLALGAALSLVHPVLCWAYLAGLGLYAILDVLASIQHGLRSSDAITGMLCVLAFPLLHIFYGLGTLTGIVRFGLGRIAGPEPEMLPPLSADG